MSILKEICIHYIWLTFEKYMFNLCDFYIWNIQPSAKTTPTCKQTQMKKIRLRVTVPKRVLEIIITQKKKGGLSLSSFEVMHICSKLSLPFVASYHESGICVSERLSLEASYTLSPNATIKLMVPTVCHESMSPTPLRRRCHSGHCSSPFGFHWVWFNGLGSVKGLD